MKPELDRDTFTAPLKKFCQQKIEPFAREDDAKEHFRRDVYRGLAELGIPATLVPEKDGGLGLSSLHYAWAMEEISKYSVAHAVSLSVTGLAQSALLEFGSPFLKETYVPRFLSGEWIGGFGLTEPTSGSDASSLKTTAKKDGAHYLLNGQKQFSTNGGEAAAYLVMARTGGPGAAGVSAFLVPAETPGFSVGKRETKMGWRASPTTALHLDNVRVPADHLVGQEGDGFKVAMRALDSGRINIAAMALGISERALEEASRYACERKQFGQAIIEFQGTGFLLADMYILIETTRSHLERVTRLKDEKANYSTLAASLKTFATDMAMKITTDAVQVLGGYGYTADYPLERLMRDAKVLQIVEGTNQIQRLIITRQLQKEFS